MSTESWLILELLTVPVRQIMRMSTKFARVQRKIQFQTASGELLEHHGEKLVPYMAQDSIVGNSYQVTAVEGPVAAVSSLNDSGMTVVFSPQGAWVCDETPLKPAGSIELKRENRTFWMDLPRADSGKVQRMMALRREQPVEQVEQIAGNPAIEEKATGNVTFYGSRHARQRR